jgi:hypothetical protein
VRVIACVVEDVLASREGLRSLDRWMDGWMDGRTDGWTDGWMDGWMDGERERVIGVHGGAVG